MDKQLKILIGNFAFDIANLQNIIEQQAQEIKRLKEFEPKKESSDGDSTELS